MIPPVDRTQVYNVRYLSRASRYKYIFQLIASFSPERQDFRCRDFDILRLIKNPITFLSRGLYIYSRFKLLLPLIRSSRDFWRFYYLLWRTGVVWMMQLEGFDLKQKTILPSCRRSIVDVFFTGITKEEKIEIQIHTSSCRILAVVGFVVATRRVRFATG